MGKLGAVPVTPRNMYRLVNAGEAVLLYPGGAKEALHQKVRALAIFLPLVSIPSPFLLVVYLPGVKGVLRSSFYRDSAVPGLLNVFTSTAPPGYCLERGW